MYQNHIFNTFYLLTPINKFSVIYKMNTNLRVLFGVIELYPTMHVCKTECWQQFYFNSQGLFTGSALYTDQQPEYIVICCRFKFAGIFYFFCLLSNCIFKLWMCISSNGVQCLLSQRLYIPDASL